MAKRFLYITGYQWACILYFAVALFCWQLKYFKHIDNNYLIFRTSYYHFKDHVNLYLRYPAEYYDVFIYGPAFTLLIAPLALLPEGPGFFIWEMGNAAAFVLAVNMLPFSNKIKTAILLLCAIEFANASHYMQFNPIIAALIIISFMLVKRQKEQYATLLIIFGTLMKLYPIAGLAFFVFSKNKVKFVGWSALWLILLFILPALISGPQFLMQSYHDWYVALTTKSELNQTLTSGQDWCIMGVARRLMHNAKLPNWPFFMAGMAIFGGALLRFKQFASLKFQLQVMCSALLMVVLFSTGSEHPTFIIAVAGAVIYIMMQQKPFTRFNIFILVLLLVVTGLGPSDAFPRAARVFMQNYAIKAWPCIVMWCIISYELLFKNFIGDKLPAEDLGERHFSL